MTSTGFAKFKNRLYRSVPLIPTHCGVFVLIVLLSPFTWSVGMSFVMIGLAILLGLVCAYSTTIFFDDYFSKNNKGD